MRDNIELERWERNLKRIMKGIVYALIASGFLILIIKYAENIK